MGYELTFRRVTAAIAGVLFFVVGGLMVYGFGGLQQYALEVRLLIALVLVLYGFMRIRGAFKRRPEGD